eukprot:TRINITY_DN7030_c0_g1_i1.p1 TRINITY_DN7030_c0_g1~~TRINITY_DN7030_c0_g1_i1.p1  ORF type:complete len:157 (-),score=18.60 TRINITY_DN7030_c0_g1_i1:87-557(-)
MKLHPIVVLLLLASMVGCFIITMFGVYPLYHDYTNTWSVWGMAVFGGSMRFIWCLGLSFFLTLCFTGYMPYIFDLFAFDGWIPISKLTYCAYLVHPLWIYSSYAMLTDFTGFTVTMYSIYFVGNITLAFAMAASLFLAVEKPCANLEALLFNRKKS